MGEPCCTRGGRRNEHRVYMERCGGKRRVGRTVQRWEDNIDIYIYIYIYLENIR
jgi:hypothetical protein